MKKFLIFIVALLSNLILSFSCSFSTAGEDIRFSLFLPEYFNYRDFKAFNYNANSFGFEYQYDAQYESNVYDWYNFANKQVPLDEINQCLNNSTFTDINVSSTNKFIEYLHKNKLNNVVQYLITAKKCEDINYFDLNDVWERSDSSQPNKSKFLEKLQSAIYSEGNPYLKRKYAFLTIRTAYYSNNFKLIKLIFERYFEKSKKDYLYYWALYFNSFQSKSRNIDIANIMAYSIEKKYPVYYYFKNNFNLEEALSLAKTKNDIANIYSYASVQRLVPNLDYLKIIYKNSYKSRILDFLLLREINKIEDWVFTPYYTNYLPSIEYANHSWSEKSNLIQSTTVLRNRSEKDRLYAKEVLKFIDSINTSKISDVKLWKTAQIYLLFMTKDYKECLRKIDAFEKQNKDERLLVLVEKIKALCITTDQATGNAIIKDMVRPILLKYLSDKLFIFSMGRELEYKSNLLDGLALISIGSNIKKYEYYRNNEIRNTVIWAGNRLKYSGNIEEFTNYFDYIDFVYSASAVQNVINNLKEHKEDNFSKAIYKQLNIDENYLKDLLGTKYIRENKLLEALHTFESISNRYWEENYNAWERDKYNDDYSFRMNPFYDIRYTKPFIPHEEKFIVTKLSVTQHLIKYLKLANDTKTNNRDYYYFLVANCYLNMTQYGSNWMMRRYSLNSSDIYMKDNDGYIDEIEFRNGKLAQNYYHLAFKYAKTDKFKALCLRMEDYAAKNIGANYEKVKSKYPEYYEDLSNCEKLERYFICRR